MIGTFVNDDIQSLIYQINNLFHLELKEVNSKDELINNSFEFIIFQVEKFSSVDTAINFIKKLKEISTDNILVISTDETNQRILQLEFSDILSVFLLTDDSTTIKIKLQNTFEKFKNPTLENPILENPILDNKEPIFKKDFHKSKTISVAGILKRSGATTCAIQILKYLQINNQKVCYIEMNDNKYIELFSDYYSEAVKKDGKIFYENCELFFDKNQIENVVKSNYDFLIFDFGILSNNNLPNFLEKDVKILVTGSTPYDIKQMGTLFETLHTKDIEYIFNFVHPKDQMSVKSAMGSLGDKIYFASNTPGYFYYSSENESMHRKILHKHMTFNSPEKPIEEAKKKSLFPFLRK